MSVRLARLLRRWAQRLDPLPYGWFESGLRGKLVYEPWIWRGRWLSERETREIMQVPERRLR